MFWQSVGQLLCVLIGLPLLLISALFGSWTWLGCPTLPFWNGYPDDSKERGSLDAKSSDDAESDRE